MPLFHISKNTLQPIEQKDFDLERELHNLIEANLETVFNCRLVASEFTTGTHHSGRIDSLALSEDGNPVIIEYKKLQSSKLITQSLFYLNWIRDHRGDFEIEVQKTLGKDTKIDWSDIRVICIAPNYSKYDLHAIETMGVNIELWKYRRFENHSLSLEKEILDSAGISHTKSAHKNSQKDKLGKDITGNHQRNIEIYTLSDHLKDKSKSIQDLVYSIGEFITGLDFAIEEVPKKHYIAYKLSQNIACLRAQKKNIQIFLKLKPSAVVSPRPKSFKDVSQVGHWATGDVKFTFNSQEEFEEIKQYIKLAYEKIGG